HQRIEDLPELAETVGVLIHGSEIPFVVRIRRAVRHRDHGHEAIGGNPPQPRVSSRSRRPSPSRLKPRISRAMAAPGAIITCGAFMKSIRPSLSIVPHSAFGGCT